MIETEETPDGTSASEDKGRFVGAHSIDAIAAALGIEPEERIITTRESGKIVGTTPWYEFRLGGGGDDKPELTIGPSSAAVWSPTPWSDTELEVPNLQSTIPGEGNVVFLGEDKGRKFSMSVDASGSIVYSVKIPQGKPAES